MNVEPLPRGTPPDSVARRALHLVTLCSVAVMQPLLDAIARNHGFLHEADVKWPELAGLVLVLACAVPATAIVLDRLAIRASMFINGWGRDTLVFVLASLAALSLLRPVLSLPYLEARLMAWMASCAAAACAGGIVVAAYQRSRVFREWLAIGACGILLFPVVFAVRVRAHAAEVSEAKSAFVVRNPAPVVIVVFDEFSGTTLMDDALKIDGERFPQFARLAAASTWYRNATTVHNRTYMAVPAMMSGRFPTVDHGPYSENYPDNLLKLVAKSDLYRMATFEPLSNLAPRVESGPRPQVPPAERLQKLLGTAVAAYPYLILPRDAPVDFPELPRVWYGLPERVDVDPQATAGGMKYIWGLERDKQIHHFLSCLRKADRPRFCFFHVVLPHYPWCFLPSGNHYISENESSYFPPNAVGDLGEDWINDPAEIARSEYRYVLQVGYVDRFIGLLQDELQRQGLWDSCLLIVTADHGVSFRPGHSRRIPDAETLPELMSIPLFVKYPGQTSGQVDDRNAETVDVVPTVLDVLDASRDAPSDGCSLRAEQQRPRKTFHFEGGTTIVEPEFPQKRDAVRRHRELFRGTPVDQPPKALCLRPEWLGRRIDELAPQDREVSSLTLQSYRPSTEVVDSRFVPTLIFGKASTGEFGESLVVIAVDGIIVDVCRPRLVQFGEHGFEVLLPESLAGAGGVRVELFVAAPDGGLSSLQRVRSWTL